MKLAELYPEGRTLYYEGPDAESPAFLAAMQMLNVEVNVTVTVTVPADKLEAVYAVTLRKGWPMGS